MKAGGAGPLRGRTWNGYHHLALCAVAHGFCAFNRRGGMETGEERRAATRTLLSAYRRSVGRSTARCHR